MPEIKHTFSGGKMNKDLDERIIPRDQYVDAMNIQVSTSEDSEVGTAQNILGNKELEIDSFTQVDDYMVAFQLPEHAITIGTVSDEKIDALYYLIWTQDADYIVAYYRGSSNPQPVFVDLNKNVLKFDSNMIITGINVIDDMLFWTDNKNEPKKINIPRCKIGTNGNWNAHTKLINKSQTSLGWFDKDIEEKHITVIKKAPITPLSMRLETSRKPNLTYTGVVTISVDNTIPNSFPDPNINDFSGFEIGDTFAIEILEGINSFGNVSGIGNIGNSDGLTGWHDGIGSGQSAIPAGTKIVFKPFNGDNVPGLPVTDYVIKGVVEDAYPGAYDPDPLSPTYNPNGNFTTYEDGILVRITHIVGFPPTTPTGEQTFRYVVDLFDETENLFEFKFPRFSYRYKYEDGEYSPFGPFTQVAFAPGSFDYHPRKGYNIGMTNNLTKVHLDGLVNEFTPKDVVSVEVLFKDEPSPNIYVVDTIRADDFPNPTTGNNMWQSLATADLTQKKQFVIKSETINNVVPSNQLLRPWDNVPRRALAQDVTGSRVVYGNYVQNYDLKSINDKKYVVNFSVNWDEVGFNDFNLQLPTSNNVNTPYTLNLNLATGATKSIKSLREYQLGVVFTDKYGRETPVISNATGAIKLEKDRAENSNKLQVSLNNSNQPQELTHFKLFVKETAGEYYNMAMDRFYDAEDGNIWLSFPSSDRNKIDIDTFLILKKGSESDILVKEAARYKVIAIENEAPDFIKTSRMLASTITDTTDNDVFGSDTATSPLIGERDFKLNYAPFFGTPGQNLHAYTDGELYIEFGKTGEIEVSDRYKIASITNDWTGINTNETGNLAQAQYSIQLVDALNSDVNFISDDPTGLNSSQIELGAKVNFYKYEVENKPQFDGRFFVKILSDDVFKRNISFSYADGLDLRVVESRRVYSMDTDHRARHTTDVGNFLTDGVSTNAPADFLPYVTSSAGSPIASVFENKYGYYAVDEFTSFALYFRRYDKTSTQQDYDASIPPNINNAIWSGSSSSIIPSRPVLRHLQPGTNTVTGNMGNDGINAAFNLWQDSSETTYLNETWSPQTNWFKEYGAETFRGGYTANFEGPQEITTLNLDGSGSFTTITTGTDVQEGIANLNVGDNARDTEVWFIDAGPFSGIRSTDNTLDWGNITTEDDDGNSFSDVNQHAIRFEQGIASSGGGWSMNLAFGGILGSIVESEFFNVGSWTSEGMSGSGNSNYLEQSDIAFVNYISTGYRFKWREDPTKQVYTIVGNVDEDRKLRHSPKEGQFIQDVGPGGVAGGAEPNSLLSMAEKVSFNFTKGWQIYEITPNISSIWDPSVPGLIDNGLEITLTTVNNDGTTGTSGDTCPDAGIDEDVVIFVSTLSGTNTGGGDISASIHQGMALRSYTNSTTFASLQTHLGATAQEFLVVRYIEDVLDANGLVTHHALYLGGYSGPMVETTDHLISTTKKPDVNTNIRFVQVGMNGYSPNSEFNINTMADDIGAVGSVGYNLEFVEDIEPEAIMSENPAIFETEPKEIKELDIYYEASNAIPMVVNSSNIHEAFPITSLILTGPFFSDPYVVIGYSGQDLIINEEVPALISGEMYRFIMPDKMQMEVEILSVQNSTPGAGRSTITINPNIYNNKIKLAWHNCYSFKNGVESNRIRDNFNLPFIANGVKVSTTLEYDYEEEHRKYGLIYSGIYNSVSGVNDTNQFIAAEKITKDINPIYGSIQKLHSRDSDLVTLCEDKVLRIQANKDALFNADGNSNVTASSNVLGQTIPFSGEYGISTNPESFASESYRAYFSDKVRGAVLRLSKDGLTPISDAGMKDWFRDNLKISRSVIGSYDDRNDEYNIKVEKYYLENLNGGDSGWIINRGADESVDMEEILSRQGLLGEGERRRVINVDTCEGLIDTGVVETSAYHQYDWLATNAPTENIQGYYFENTYNSLADYPSACDDAPNGGIYYQLFVIRVAPSSDPSDYLFEFYTVNDFITWANANGYPTATTSMSFLEIDVLFGNQYQSTEYVFQLGGMPCQCYGELENSGGSIDEESNCSDNSLGPWQDGVSYSAGEVVEYQGEYWTALSTSNPSLPPSTVESETTYTSNCIDEFGMIDSGVIGSITNLYSWMATNGHHDIGVNTYYYETNRSCNSPGNPCIGPNGGCLSYINNLKIRDENNNTVWTGTIINEAVAYLASIGITINATDGFSSINRTIINSQTSPLSEYRFTIFGSTCECIEDVNSGGINWEVCGPIQPESVNEDDNNYNIIDCSKVLSWKEDVKGWVSFKSFVQMQLAVSMANDYYTFKAGRLYRHYEENAPRNTFYNEHTSSTIDVVLNGNPSFTKVFQTINYEGSQSKIDSFKIASIPYMDQNLSLVYSNYSDQEYYNLSQKDGWYLESIITDKEDGYINEFLEKESKWFNYIKKEINPFLANADTGDFSFQGIGEVVTTTNIRVRGWEDDPIGSVNNNEDTHCDISDNSIISSSGEETELAGGQIGGDFGEETSGGGDPQDSGEEGVDGDNGGSATGFSISGCTDPTASNYNPNATVDDGSCFFDGSAGGGGGDGAGLRRRQTRRQPRSGTRTQY